MKLFTASIKNGLADMLKKTKLMGQTLGQTMDQRILIPCLRHTAKGLNRLCEKRIQKYSLRSEWKDRVLEDFSLWLAQTDTLETRETNKDDCDLYTLLAEFVGLRQEIKFQNREQAKSSKTISAFIDNCNATFALLERSSEDLRQLEKNISLSSERKALSHFFDVRDILIRGLDAVKKSRASRGIFSGGKKELDRIIEGYEIAIGRFDRAMEMSGIEPVQALNQPFNPKEMKAVSSEKRVGKKTGIEKGTVIKQIACGFKRKEEVLKFAEVIVAE